MLNDTNRLFSNERFQRMLIIVLLMLALFIAAKTVNEFKQYRFIGGGVPATNIVTLSGEGEVFAVPDIALFSFSVIEEKPNAKGAQDVAAEKVNAILTYLRKEGTEERDIKTLNYNVYPRYEYRRDACPAGGFCPPTGERELVGFEVNQTIQVKVRDTELAGEILAGVGERGASQVSGLTFTIDEEEELLRQARQKAIVDAQEKAKILAQDLGVRLVRIVSFSEYGGIPPVIQRFDIATQALGVGGALPASAPELPKGENKITSNVSITYEIR